MQQIVYQVDKQRQEIANDEGQTAEPMIHAYFS